MLTGFAFEKCDDVLSGDGSEFGLDLVLHQVWVILFLAFGNGEFFVVRQFGEVFQDGGG